MYKGFALITLLMLGAVPAYTAEPGTQIINYSGSVIEEPYWFKDSFLDIADDLQEADEAGKNLLIYFHQAGCPYCYNIVQQSFLDPQLGPFIQANFDVIALNLWGDREITLPNGEVLTEKALAVKWKVQFTPTLFFYTDKPEPSLRIDGYRSKEMLAKVIDYVMSGSEGQYLAQKVVRSEANAALYPSHRFSLLNEISQLKSSKPLAVLFEYPACADCEQLHKAVISRKDTDQLLANYTALRVDVSDQTPRSYLANQQPMTAKQWADHLGLTYFPSLVLLDEKKQERFRIDSYVQAFHFQAALEYVDQKIYQREPEFQRYINERADNLRKTEKKVVITE